MRTIQTSATPFAAVLAVIVTALVLVGLGYRVAAETGRGAVPQFRADGSTTLICPFNMSWDGAGCR